LKGVVFKDNPLREIPGLANIGFFKGVNMDLTGSSHAKQVIGIILVVVFLLAITVYGTRKYRESKEFAAFFPKRGASKIVPSQTETCQAEDGSCSLKSSGVR